MTTLNVNTITPAGNTLTLGESGDTVVVTDDVKVNTVKDAGGNTLWVSDGSGNLSSINSGIGGSIKLITTSTFTSQTTVDFTSEIDSTYKEYVFRFFDINPSASDTHFCFQVNAVGGSGFDETFTSTAFQAYHNGADNDYDLDDVWGGQQGTAYNRLGMPIGGDADQCGVGELHLFNPSSTTYVKQFYGTGTLYNNPDYTVHSLFAGFINSTAAIDEVSFKFESGTFDGTIKMYGISS